MAISITDWHALAKIGKDSNYPLDGDYVLENDLDEYTDGYDQNASYEANATAPGSAASTTMGYGDGEKTEFEFRIDGVHIYYIATVDEITVGGSVVTDYTVDYTNGLVTFSDPPSDEEKVEADFTYYGAWEPIGSESGEFTGSFDGQNYKIKDLLINRRTVPEIGLFARCSNAHLYNINIENYTIWGEARVGALAGEFTDEGSIEGCLTKGSMISYRDSIGGLVGECSNDTDTPAMTIENCVCEGTIEHKDTSSNGYDGIGGVIGHVISNINILDCYSNCNIVDIVNSNNNTGCGGIVGYAIVDEMDLYIYHCCYNGEITSRRKATGGIVGYSDNYYENKGLKIENSYCCSDIINDNASDNFGGIVGYSNNHNYIIDCHFNGNIKKGSNVTESSYTPEKVGGIFGHIEKYGFVSNCYATGEIYGSTDLGGIGGRMESIDVSDCYFKGNIIGYSLSYYYYDGVGGIIGGMVEGEMERCFFNGDISGEGGGNAHIGGLVGHCSSSPIYNSYSKGKFIIDVDDNTIGGAVGDNDSNLQKCYASMDFSISGDNNTIGGLLGANSGDINNSFWNIDLYSTSSGGTGKTEEEMKDISTYTDTSTEGLDSPWDFVDTPNEDTGEEDIWNINSNINNGYPYLMFSLTPNEINIKKIDIFNDSPIRIKKNGTFKRPLKKIKINNQFIK